MFQPTQAELRQIHAQQLGQLARTQAQIEQEDTVKQQTNYFFHDLNLQLVPFVIAEEVEDQFPAVQGAHRQAALFGPEAGRAGLRPAQEEGFEQEAAAAGQGVLRELREELHGQAARAAAAAHQPQQGQPSGLGPRLR